MNILHFEKGLHYTDRELLLLARKLGKMATYCKRVKSEASFIRVDAERRTTKKEEDSVKVTITVDLPGESMRAESRRFFVLDAIDRCVDKLEPQLKRYKELHTRRGRDTKFRRRARQNGHKRKAA